MSLVLKIKSAHCSIYELGEIFKACLGCSDLQELTEIRNISVGSISKANKNITFKEVFPAQI